MAMRRIVVVGCGSIGQRHARLLSERADVQVELCDSRGPSLQECIAKIGECRCHPDFHDMLASRPDAVVVATPHACHADQAIAALNAGIHTLCEKPMSDSLGSAVCMAEAARASAAVLEVGFTLHFHPGLIRLKSLITSGVLGRLVHMYCRVGTYATLTSSRSRYQEQVEGALLLDYVHQPDLLYWLSGREPTGVYMSAAVAGELPLRSNPNVADLVLDYAGELLGAIHINYVQAPQRHEYEIVGDGGWAILDAESNRLRVALSDGGESVETFPFERDDMFREEHQAFLDAVDGKREPESAPDSALVSMRVVAAALEAWKTRTRVALPG